MMSDIEEFNFFCTEKAENIKTAQKKSREGPKFLIDILLGQGSQSSGQIFSTQEIINEFITFIGARMSTTGSLVSMAAY